MKAKSAGVNERAAALRQTIRDMGLRVTASRVSVLEYVEDEARPLSHADVADALSPNGFDRATIYRNLIDLTEVGLLTRTDLGDHIWRFEYRRYLDDLDKSHPHFVCEACGRIICMLEETVKVEPSPGSATSGIGEIRESLFKGLCDRCV
jgi:Fur family transcriptional regulator, ferric uptake regulator